MRDLEGGLEAVALTPSASSGEVALSGNGGRGQRKGGDLIRESIFKGEFGEFALIGSIFRCLGTPTVQTWPVRTLLLELLSTTPHIYLYLSCLVLNSSCSFINAGSCFSS